MGIDRSDGAPDAVVIGAGHNGLVAANILADAGWDVVVCEATAEPGGAVRSAQVTAPGFVSDLFSAFYPLGAASPVLQALELERHGLTWSHAPAVLSHVLPDGRSATMYRDVALTAESVSSFAAEDGIAWRELVAQWRQVEQPLLQTKKRPFPPVVPAARLARRVGRSRPPPLRVPACPSTRRVGLAGLARRASAAMLPARRFGVAYF